jgi:hypothetical protein
MEIETGQNDDTQTYEVVNNHRSKHSKRANSHSSSSSPYPTNTNRSSQKNKQ